MRAGQLDVYFMCNVHVLRLKTVFKPLWPYNTTNWWQGSQIQLERTMPPLDLTGYLSQVEEHWRQ